MTSRIDVIIFGATGFAGKCLVREAVRVSCEDMALTWAVAARSTPKLSQVVKDIEKETGKDLSSLKMITADACDREALKRMTSQAKVLINCTGPFLDLGDAVVQSCINTATHYVDIAAEIQFMQKNQLKYNRQAVEAGVYVVSACALECIPTDLCLVFLQQRFQGVLNSAESFMTLDIPKEYRKLGTPLVNYGTFDSLVNMVARSGERESLRRQLYPLKLPEFLPKQNKRRLMYNNFNNWFLPSDLADEDVVYVTQRYFYDSSNQRPIQFKSYLGIPSRFEACLLITVLAVAYCMFKSSITRKFILKHPKVFTLGYISRNGVPDKVMNSITFSCYVRGEGWDETVKDIECTTPNKILTAKVSGVNPGYAFTAISALQSALTILNEQDKMPGRGGVLTPGVAFADTSLISKLGENGYKFEIISDSPTTNVEND